MRLEYEFKLDEVEIPRFSVEAVEGNRQTLCPGHIGIKRVGFEKECRDRVPWSQSGGSREEDRCLSENCDECGKFAEGCFCHWKRRAGTGVLEFVSVALGQSGLTSVRGRLQSEPFQK